MPQGAQVTPCSGRAESRGRCRLRGFDAHDFAPVPTPAAVLSLDKAPPPPFGLLIEDVKPFRLPAGSRLAGRRSGQGRSRVAWMGTFLEGGGQWYEHGRQAVFVFRRLHGQ